MKLRMLFGIFLIHTLTACSSMKQTVIADEVIFYGEGTYWNVKYIYNPELYEDKKVNWVEMGLKNLELSQDELSTIDIEFEGRDGVITGNVGDLITKLNKNVITFLIGTVNNETYKEDEYKIKIKFKGQQDIIRMQLLN